MSFPGHLSFLLRGGLLPPGREGSMPGVQEEITMTAWQIVKNILLTPLVIVTLPLLLLFMYLLHKIDEEEQLYGRM